jgi:hypothetical protein
MLTNGNRNILRITCHSATLSTKSPSSNVGIPQVGLSDITYEIDTIDMLVIFHLQTKIYVQYVLAFMTDLHTELKSTSANCLLRVYQNQTKIFKKNKSKSFHFFDLYFTNFRLQKRFVYFQCLLPYIILGPDIK